MLVAIVITIRSVDLGIHLGVYLGIHHCIGLKSYACCYTSELELYIWVLMWVYIRVFIKVLG